MSKDIVIGIHGEAQNLNGVVGLQTYGVDGGKVDWIPEEEAVLKGKFITENGTYEAKDDGALGYTRVVVMEVASVGQDKTVTDKKGKNVAIAEGGHGRGVSRVKKIEVNNSSVRGTSLMVPKPTVETQTLSVNEPGVYNIKDVEGMDGYSRVTVKVSDADRDEAGFNPVNPTYMDDLPTEIRVTKSPNITEYDAGDLIDYTGMVVVAYRENGTIWTNDNYPDGIIPLSELILGSETADRKKGWKVNLEPVRVLLEELYKNVSQEVKDADINYLCSFEFSLTTSVFISGSFYGADEIWATRRIMQAEETDIYSTNEYPMVAIKHTNNYYRGTSKQEWPDVLIITPAHELDVATTITAIIEERLHDKSTFTTRDYENARNIKYDFGNGIINTITMNGKVVEVNGGRISAYKVKLPSSIWEGYVMAIPGIDGASNVADSNMICGVPGSEQGTIIAVPGLYIKGLPSGLINQFNIASYLAWVIKYGGMLFKIEWPRPVDNKLLSTAVYIDIR